MKRLIYAPVAAILIALMCSTSSMVDSVEGTWILVKGIIVTSEDTITCSDDPERLWGRLILLRSGRIQLSTTMQDLTEAHTHMKMGYTQRTSNS